ncbi:hypothetical protein MUK42_27787 [Musa troglodytarum]|uniref:Uncharacterized protein n=1 Tax=Musa troglodytarum TaxID=320322 RepID=A0A9E7FJE5_9LILI|nr:hypothetical protein MUK42_27787 [Musa troglodytarum]
MFCKLKRSLYGTQKRSGGRRSSMPSGHFESGICSRKVLTLLPSTPSLDPSLPSYVETAPWNQGQWVSNFK